jgi:hypothetical protein
MLYNYMLQFYRDAIWDAENTWMVVVGNFQKVTGKEKEKKKENER